jgi:hypothetical protein
VGFAAGSVLQHQAARRSSDGGGLAVRALLSQRTWLVGQAVTATGSIQQVVALGLAPVSIVQPLLLGGAGGRAGHPRGARGLCASRVELLGAVCAVGGLAVFLGAARPAPGLPEHLPSALVVAAAVVVCLGLVAMAGRLPHGPVGALICGAIAEVVAGAAAVLISTALEVLGQGAAVRVLAIVALVAAAVAAVAEQLSAQQAYSRGSLAWSLPALTLADPLAAVPVARLLLGTARARTCRGVGARGTGGAGRSGPAGPVRRDMPPVPGLRRPTADAGVS